MSKTQKSGKDASRKNSIRSNIQELEAIIKYFESEEIDLDEAISKYERATELVGLVNEVLKKYETRVNKISERDSKEE